MIHTGATIFAVFAVVILFMVYIFSPPHIVKAESSSVSIYIINTRHCVDFYDNEAWLLQYSVNGKIEQASFWSEEEQNVFIEYLKNVGDVYETKN